ncbi:histidine phosphatase family protein [Sphingomonas sp. ABOLD]|jgi:broad specificity phosphatase PhoE|uniref:Histidine phosphatase family protein n=1 Tax=Sphingomonas floccifaciens TaxID=1844115 RepID=A0ABW4NHG0_9SPHN|nr:MULTISPECIES: histidine phosphatase family protein [Sphingomonas]RSV48381.1 histidine phosphatase family protein [Sphingomonas sp. ABOLD]
MTGLPQFWLVRHGETAWSLTRQHTGRSDIPLTKGGEEAAQRLSERLPTRPFSQIWSSPSQRARRTGELAGFSRKIAIVDDLAEWDYGAYEGRTTKEILADRPDWMLFRDGCPQGETPDDITARADRVVERLRASTSDILIFSSAHILRVLAARWLGLPAAAGALFILDTASISILGYEHNDAERVIRGWNLA